MAMKTTWVAFILISKTVNMISGICFPFVRENDAMTNFIVSEMIWTFISGWTMCCCVNRLFLWSNGTCCTTRHHQKHKFRDLIFTYTKHFYITPEWGWGRPVLSCQCCHLNMWNDCYLQLSIYHMEICRSSKVFLVITFAK